ncbi:GSCFA domain-containing protein [Lentibacter algarum]|uniref:GSCFA domain-containing protein n=1 Tax=Lentibacter algarum TaxID=576131 RepID=UPI001C075151|nr:GSCFA domain-containing protein [Lentibacter algarum]MBU2981019.1 GSCFA domain-containing protein [Lentibacter algarum]
MSNPYENLAEKAFWRSAVADKGAHGLERLWSPRFEVKPEHRIVTSGSCFAQHFGKALSARGYCWFDAEPAPPWLRGEDASAFNYGVFSVRTGNIYTPRMLLQWLKQAFGDAKAGELWELDGRWYDPLRPVIEPEGFTSRDELLEARHATLVAMRKAVREGDVYVFTLGLTECWRNTESGLEYALCPGTTAGTQFDAKLHRFHNTPVSEAASDLEAAIALLRRENPSLKVLLTVSPVPLIASASGEHVLTATSYSKSVLRAIAGEAAARHDNVDYFPSYEIITHPVFRGMFYASNMRSVEPQGVQTVMSHFFAEQERVFGPPSSVPTKKKKAKGKKRKSSVRSSDVKCEEELLSAFEK